MIGLVLRGLCASLPGEGFLVGVFGSALAICAVCGVHRCMRMRMRDCGCIKRCMRATGADKFDDFEMLLVVHEATMTTNHGKLATLVRVTAGLHTVETDQSSKGNFQQPLAVFVEQGTTSVDVELLGVRGRKVLAWLKLDPIQDILRPKQQITEKLLPMKQKSKGVLNPKIKISVMLDIGSEAEKGLLSGVDLGSKNTMMVTQQLRKVKEMEQHHNEASEDPGYGGTSGALSDQELLAKGCCGPVEMFLKWGKKEPVYLGVRGPPYTVRYFLGVYKEQDTFDECPGVKGEPHIDLLKVLSVQPDPARTEVFVVNYQDDKCKKQRLFFRRQDRTRDVWVEMLQLLIKMCHEQRETRKKSRIV